MIRRRRPRRETPFSFDSFLDLVTNVVGIIIRMILVVWVGARSYTGLMQLAKPARPITAAAQPQASDDPLEPELARQRQELAQAQARLLEQLRQLDQAEAGRQQTEKQLAGLPLRRQELLQVRADLEAAGAGQGETVKNAALSLQELQKRSERLLKEIEELHKLPPANKVIRYRTPVSEPVHSEERHFECRQGRATFVARDALVDEAMRTREQKLKLLQTRWEVTDVTAPVGAFRLRYKLERERGTLDVVREGAFPSARESFGVEASWELEPVTEVRGETAGQALGAGSQFRRVVDPLSPDQSVVTLWVYPDSFAVYRQLRDYLIDRGLTVAGRPMPEDAPIGWSPRGSASRGQ